MMSRAAGALFILASMLLTIAPVRGETPPDGAPLRLRAVDLNEWIARRNANPSSSEAVEFTPDESEPARIARHASRVTRVGPFLTLRLDNGYHVVLTEGRRPIRQGRALGCYDCVFRFEDFWDDLGLYLISSGYYHDDGMTIVSAATGDAVTTVGDLHRVPGRSDLILSIISSDMDGYRLEVWQVGGGTMRRTQRCPELPYGSELVRWEPDGSIVLRRLTGATETNGERIWVEEAFRLDGDRITLPACR